MQPAAGQNLAAVKVMGIKSIWPGESDVEPTEHNLSWRFFGEARLQIDSVRGSLSPDFRAMQRQAEELAVSTSKVTLKISYHVYDRIDEIIICTRILAPDAQTILDLNVLPPHGSCDSLFGAPKVTATPWTSQDFYSNLTILNRQENPQLPPLDGLMCKLYPFQKRALAWMLNREQHVDFVGSDAADPPGSFIKHEDADGRRCWLNPALLLVTTNTELLKMTGRDQPIGILAEEMGLGKTVEILALIISNPQTPRSLLKIESEDLIPCPATLIVLPVTLMQQWRDEITSLAPGLKVMSYEGIRRDDPDTAETDMLSAFCAHDVVLVSYSMLGKEFYYANATQRTLRREKKYAKRQSMLIRVRWWRIILDEAQMVDKTTSNPAMVASRLRRHIAWCVSGTPAKSASDLFGLLAFLHYKPYDQIPKRWQTIIEHHRALSHQIFREICLRHTKALVRDEVQLPSQKRVIVTVPFSNFEQQHYRSLYERMAKDCGLSSEGAPLSNEWEPDPQTLHRMREWLTRLRQSCLHPEVGSWNRRALGNETGPPRSVVQVLQAMIEQNDGNLRLEQRSRLSSKLRRGQIHELAGNAEIALEVWLSCMQEATALVSECETSLESRLAREESKKTTDDLIDEARSKQAKTDLISAFKQRLHGARELLHKAVFFSANAYFQLKEEEIINTRGWQEKPDQVNSATQIYPMTLKAHELESKEMEMYAAAGSLRVSMLTESRSKVERSCRILKKRLRISASFSFLNSDSTARFVKGQTSLPEATILQGLISQVHQVTLWRAKTMELLLLPLVDAEGSDVQGDEYEKSAKAQDDLYAHVDALRSLISDILETLTGNENLLINHEMKNLYLSAKRGHGHSPALTAELLERRHKLRPEHHKEGSLRALISERRIRHSRRAVGDEITNGQALVSKDSRDTECLQSILDSSLKEQIALEKEVHLMTITMNDRIDYYRQLQAISDTVVSLETEVLNEYDQESLLREQIRCEVGAEQVIKNLEGRARYLRHLENETKDLVSPQTCIICTATISDAILTSCGHIFCFECFRFWWRQHRNCPMCKSRLGAADFQSIATVGRAVQVSEEIPLKSGKDLPNTLIESNALYSTTSHAAYSQTETPKALSRFGSKIGAIARHVLWIRQQNPGAKTVVFSQFRDFLGILSKAFEQSKIGFTNIEQKDGIQLFKTDPKIECFLLSAKAQASGLNLVSATNVILCEPLINVAIELQVIARVHRIGQHCKTTVWMFLMEDTIENSVYRIATKRRLSQLASCGKSKRNEHDSSRLRDEDVENSEARFSEISASTRMLAKGAKNGEVVEDDDLWGCLFGPRSLS